MRDIVTAESMNYAELSDLTVIDKTLAVFDTRASSNLMKLSPTRRNCLFSTESNLDYFDVNHTYTNKC